VRSPACFTGLYAFKPTSGRFPLQGLTFYSATSGGEHNLRTSLGPIAKSVDDCVLLTKAFTENLDSFKMYESVLHQVIRPFDDSIYTNRSKKLKIGYFKTYECFEASMSNQRAVDVAIQALREAGHELVEVELPNIERTILLFFEI